MGMDALGRAAERGVEPCKACSFQQVAEVEFRTLGEDLRELKTRVHELERTLARGVMLLIANLTGLLVALAKEMI